MKLRLGATIPGGSLQTVQRRLAGSSELPQGHRGQWNPITRLDAIQIPLGTQALTVARIPIIAALRPLTGASINRAA